MTIKFAEEVAAYLNRMGVKAHHLHSEIDTIERTEIINALRLGHIDVIVGINLLREGWTFLKSASSPSLTQTVKVPSKRAQPPPDHRSSCTEPKRQGASLCRRVLSAMEAAIRQTLERRQRQHAEQRGPRHHAENHREGPPGHGRYRERHHQRHDHFKRREATPDSEERWTKGRGLGPTSSFGSRVHGAQQKQQKIQLKIQILN